MSVKKRSYPSGKTVWYYVFDKPGSTRQDRLQVKASGFSIRKDALDAEAKRRVEVQRQAESPAVSPVPLPTTLGDLLQEFFERHAEKKLAAKTTERYREQAAYLSPDLRAMPLPITPLRFSDEWDRLLESGGRHRKTKKARPLSKKLIRNIAGVVSSAYVRAIRWGLASFNPVPNSEPPVPVRREGIALTPAQQSLVIEAALGCWCLSAFLELSAATGARRGEVLALAWSDLHDGHVVIARSLSQTKAGLKFKGTKTGRERHITLPQSAVAAL